MRQLVLVRHAKSQQDGSPDAERALAPRGVRDSRAVGRRLTALGVVPDRVVVSPARRAQQTWALARAELDRPGAEDVDDRVYENTVEDLLDVVRDTPDDVTTLVLVGHNPSMHGLTVELDDGNGPPEVRAEVDRKYPTSGIALLTLDVDWARVGPKTATLASFDAPRG
ncbi:MAG: SixA phosphatase family protein [Actinomycetes bacterium]